MNHTPGNWVAHPRNSGCDAWQVVPEGEGTMRICIITNDREYEEGNARLIAAAPKLLKALQQFLSAWDDNDVTTTPAMEAAEKAARAAIAKAERQ